MKKIYILVSNGGDGSYGIIYVLDKAVIDFLQKAYNEDRVNFEYCPGVDGDGFSYDTLNVPENMTIQDLGISEYSVITMDDVEEYLE